MKDIYDYKSINKGVLSVSGHSVYKHATYSPNGKEATSIVFKENKNHKMLFSQFEVAFSDLARRFFQPNLTPNQSLVSDNNQIVGLAAEHHCYVAARREGPSVFYSLEEVVQEKQYKFRLKSFTPATVEETPIYFLDQFDSGFFSRLWQAYKSEEINFDMSSLASVLTASYTLEEDDLHKGNFGFYLVKKNNCTTVVFFKIDNDMMLTDSVMSHCGSRIVNWGHREHAFDVTERDVVSFPKLYDSQNYHWPTYRVYFANPLDKKIYSNENDIRAFVELGSDKEFQQAKWREFYKHILIPPKLIEDDLAQVFSQENPNNRAQIAMLKEAVIARQAKLRAVLFSIPAFRDFVANYQDESNGLQNEIVFDRQINTPEVFVNQITADMQRYQALCLSETGFAAGDTPLHVAIRLNDFRYHESWHAFSQFAEQRNRKGEKPLDLAIAKMLKTDPYSTEDVRQDPFFTSKWLLQNGVRKTESYQQLEPKQQNLINTYLYGRAYLDKASKADCSNDLIQLMQAISEDNNYCLKMKKELALACMRGFIVTQKHHPDLKQILSEMKVALNGARNTEPAPELQFIRQLRSHLWIIRIIRGLFGGTATKVELNGLINKELSRFQPSGFPYLSFFFNKKGERTQPVVEKQNNLSKEL